MRKLSRKPNPFPLRPNGFTLIELMVVLTILAVTATILIKSSVGLQDQGRYDQTVDRVNKIKQAIVNVQTVNGVPTVSGFVADMGRLPVCLRELLDGNQCNSNSPTLSDPAWGVIGLCSVPPTYATQAICNLASGTWGAIGSCVNVATGITTFTDLATCNSAPGTWRQLTMSVGWNGPYLQTSNNPAQPYAFSDGWGNDYAFPSTTTASTSCAAPYSLITFPNNQSNCADLDTFNYGWRFDSYDPPNQATPPNATTTYNYLLNLQSYGSDGLPDAITTTNEPYQADYPATNISQPAATPPLIHLQDWLFNLGTELTVLNSNSYQPRLQPTSVTINLSHTSPGPLTFTATTADLPTVCTMVGGTWTTPNCMINSTLCGVLGGTWNGTSTTNGSCTLYQQPLQSLCTSRSAGGSWSSASGGQCTLTTLSSPNCALLNGTYANGSCTIPAPTTPLPTLATTCAKLSGSGTPCQLNSTTPIFSNAAGVSGISDFCAAIGAYWNPTALTCFIAAPLLPFTPSACIANGSAQCTQNICLNIFYRNLSAATPIVVATASATVTNDGQPHVLGFQGFSVYDLSGGAVIDNSNPANPPLPVPIPVGQNAISVTQANSDGSLCKATPGTTPILPWTNPAYPANHPAGPVPQTFLPGLPLIFNW